MIVRRTEILTTRVVAYFFSEELMQKKLCLVAFFRKGDNFSSHNLVKIHWWQNNYFCVADVMVSTEGLTQERSVYLLKSSEYGHQDTENI